MGKQGGITSRMRRAFVIYLAGHNRPMHELLPPQVHDIKDVYEKEFIGMTIRDVSIEELEKTHERLFAEFPSSLDDAERRFLHSVHRREPDCNLLGIPNVKSLPAI